MSDCNRIYRIEDDGETFEISVGGETWGFRGDDAAFLSLVPRLLNIAEAEIRKHDLSPREQSELARGVLLWLHRTSTTTRNEVRQKFRIPLLDEGAAAIRRYADLKKEIVEELSRMASEFHRDQNRKSAPVAGNVTDTMRTRYLDDPRLFPMEFVKIRGSEIEKRKFIDALRQRTEATVFRTMSGEEYHLFLKIYELWFRSGRASEVIVERDNFIEELGVVATGGALQLRIAKIKAILEEWSERKPYKIIAPKSETKGVDFTADCYLPRFREYIAKKRGERTAWKFSDFDVLLFGGHDRGYHKIATRPFALLTESLGGTGTAERAKHAVGIILTELGYDRTRTFEIGLDTLRLTSEDFARNVDPRHRAMEEIQQALAKIGVKVTFGQNSARVEPRQGARDA